MRLSEIGPLEAASLDTGLGEKKKKEFCNSKTSPVPDVPCQVPHGKGETSPDPGLVLVSRSLVIC